MPRRYSQYSEREVLEDGTVVTPYLKKEIFEFYHSMSTYGSWVLILGFVLIAYYLIRSLYNGKVAGSNPWGALTLEWEIPSPPPPHNFLEEPVYKHGPYAYDKVIKEKTVD